MSAKPTSVRKVATSTSGFSPGSSSRYSLRIRDSPTTTEVFDCSTPSAVTQMAMIAIACLYLTLNAAFIGVVQVLVGGQQVVQGVGPAVPP